jgi:GT2 family glycosyltransferase
MKSKLAVVILNWNGVDFLKQFLSTVIQFSSEAEIIVADNASTDDSVPYLQTHFPEVKIIQNENNGGFAKGYNDALKHVESEYYVLLNSDIEVTENWLQPLLQFMENNPRVAACQPKVLSFHNKKLFEHAGAAGGFIDRNYFPFCRGRIFETVEEDLGQYDFETELFWATGACFMIRSSVYWEVNGFDEDFFAHMEEIDLCWRIKKRAHSIFAIPSSVVYHVGGGTLAYKSPRKTYLNFRNSLFMITKNHEGLLIPKLVYRMTLDGMAGMLFFFTGRWSHVWAILKSHFHFYGSFSTMYKKREKSTPKSSMNKIGFYNGSILWANYFKRIKRFNALNKRLFITKAD